MLSLSRGDTPWVVRVVSEAGLWHGPPVQAGRFSVVDADTGDPLPYVGPLYKLKKPEGPPPTALVADLSLGFAFLPGKDYRVSLAGAVPLEFSTGDRVPRHPQEASLVTSECSESRAAALETARLTAVTAMETAFEEFIETNRCGGTSYKEWFGPVTASRYSRVTRTLAWVRDQLVSHDQGGLLGWNARCGGPSCDGNVIAYVFPGGSTVYVCSPFWAMPTGIADNSRAGTIVHELSHFTGAGVNTLDHAYGVDDCLALALLDPDLAVDNADSYQYFTERPKKSGNCTHICADKTERDCTVTQGCGWCSGADVCLVAHNKTTPLETGYNCTGWNATVEDLAVSAANRLACFPICALILFLTVLLRSM